MAGGMATTVFLLSLFFQHELGYSPLRTSAAFLPYGVVQVGSGLVAGRVVGRFGVRTVTVLGLILVAVGLASFGLMDAGSAYAGLPLIGLLSFGVGAALTFASAMAAAVDDLADKDAGLAGGVVNTAMETGPTVGFAVLISLGGMAFGTAAAVFVLTAIVAMFTLRMEKVR